jgi:hypothetical protein
MKRILITFVAIYAVILGTSSCGGSSNNSTPAAAAQSFVQIERLGRPAIKEVFQQFNNHDNTNRSSPYAVPLASQSLFIEIGSFAQAVGRSSATAAALQSILIPDAIEADLSQPGASAYLGVETAGATGSKFGGRGLLDDVVDIDLGALFGNTVSAVTPTPDDHAEIPCLTTDNVPPNAAAHNINVAAGFPYVGTPF